MHDGGSKSVETNQYSAKSGSPQRPALVFGVVANSLSFRPKGGICCRSGSARKQIPRYARNDKSHRNLAAEHAEACAGFWHCRKQVYPSARREESAVALCGKKADSSLRSE